MKYGFFEDSRSVFSNVQTSREDAVFLLHGCLLHLQPWMCDSFVWGFLGH